MEIIEWTLKVLPLEKWGLNREQAEPVAGLILTGVFSGAGYAARFIFLKFRSSRRAIKAMMPDFDWASIRKARRYFIPTQFQNASPARQEEPGFTHLYVSRSKLIPFFIKTAFNQRLQFERFYLVLGDSGMGKTTFLINLYLKYYSPLNRHRDLKMRLFRLAEPDTLKNIGRIPAVDVRDTILLLDGLDEDRLIYPEDASVPAEEAFRKRLDEIISATRSFSIVVMTCRTQYFPGQEDDPYELKIRRSDENGYYFLNKLYLSPFTMREVRRYLRKRYGWFLINYRKKKRAEQIVEKAEKLVMRPMLLSYIHYLLQEYGNSWNVLAIYEAMVRNWLEREAAKRKGNVGRADFIQSLEALSKHLAVLIYRKWNSEHRLWLTHDETMELARRYNIQLEPHEITGQSLLTSDGAGNWKFAHRSIMEYFLAMVLVSRPTFLAEFDFAGQDMVKEFYEHTWNPFVEFRNPSARIGQKMFVTSKLLDNESGDLFNKDKPVMGTFVTYSLKEAIDLCDRLNAKAGYPPVYNEAGLLHNELCRGFRLPTPGESRYSASLPEVIEYAKLPEVKVLAAKRGVRVPAVNAYGISDESDYPALFPGQWCVDSDFVLKAGQWFGELTRGQHPHLRNTRVDISHALRSGEQCGVKLVFVP